MIKCRKGDCIGAADPECCMAQITKMACSRLGDHLVSRGWRVRVLEEPDDADCDAGILHWEAPPQT